MGNTYQPRPPSETSTYTVAEGLADSADGTYDEELNCFLSARVQNDDCLVELLITTSAVDDDGNVEEERTFRFLGEEVTL